MSWKNKVGITKPEFVDAKFKKDFVDLVNSGKAVNMDLLDVNNCYYLAYVLDEGKLVGVGAIKNQDNAYKKSVMSDAKSGYEFPFEFKELGYFSVSNDYRGLGIAGDIAERLCETYTNPLYATTGNPTMKNIFIKNGFIKKGKAWTGIYTRSLELFIRR